jgi:hypothetical protein
MILSQLQKYAEDKDLLSSPVSKCVIGFAQNKKHFRRMYEQTKLFSKARYPTYRLGNCVPSNVKEAYELDKQNGNT